MKSAKGTESNRHYKLETCVAFLVRLGYIWELTGYTGAY